MNNHFQTQGRTLLSNGYLIVPISKGEKRPALSSWQKARLGVGDLPSYPNHGVGVLCGQGANPIVGVDIDVSHPTIGPALIEWCQQHLGYGGERVGAAPRILLAYRAASSGWAKGSSVKFFDPTDPLKPNGKRNEQQIEILGLGQQFVAYHEHPDTLRDYEWVDMMGGLEYMRATDLPIITEDMISALMLETSRLVRATTGVEMTGAAALPSAGGSFSDDDLMGLTAKVGITLDEVRDLAIHLKNDGDDYDTWTHVGMALHHEFSDTDDEGAALDLWREYGSRSSKDDPAQYAYKWRSFGKVSRKPTTLRWLLKIAHMAKQDNEVAEKRQQIEQIRKLISDTGDQVTLGGDTARRIRELLPDDQLIRTEVLGAFAARFKSITGSHMPVVQARQLLIGPRHATVKAKRPLTEFGNAERMLDRYGDGLMYVPETDSWYSWTGVYWRKSVSVEIEHLAKETIRALPTEANDHDDQGEFFAFCAISQQVRMVRSMVSLASSDPRVAVPASELDAINHLLGVANGAVDLRSGLLIPPNPEHRITLTTSCEYVPTAKCPLFERTTLEIFGGDLDMTDYFLRSIGYALMGNPKEDRMFIPFGNGANGKSTMFGVVRKVFGGYARAAEAASFVTDTKAGGNAGGAREDLVRLRGARFVYVNEPDEGGELREGAVKSMTGGDAITARGLYAKASIEIVPSWVVFMPTNHKPIVKGTDNGIWRRLDLMPFERNFETDTVVEKDPNREEKLMAEMQGVLALFVRSALSYQKIGLTQPQVVRAARENYRSQMDLLAEWLDECCEIGGNLSEVSSRLWLSWEQFAKNRGILHYVKSSVALGRRLDSRFLGARGSSGARIRLGIRLKTDF